MTNPTTDQMIANDTARFLAVAAQDGVTDTDLLAAIGRISHVHQRVATTTETVTIVRPDTTTATTVTGTQFDNGGTEEDGRWTFTKARVIETHGPYAIVAHGAVVYA